MNCFPVWWPGYRSAIKAGLTTDRGTTVGQGIAIREISQMFCKGDAICQLDTAY